jgi:predicted ThiF/HesA family dinucleotide-utilizing enzyme
VECETTITADVPAESRFMKSEGGHAKGGHAKVGVVAGSVASNNVPFNYELRVDSVTPKRAGPRGETPVKIRGYGFGKAGSHDIVVFLPAHGGSPSDATVATNVRVQSDTTIVADVPAESHFMKSEGGHAKVGVVAASVPSNNVSFNYELRVDSITPNRAGPHGGTPIKISGYGFGKAGSHDIVVFIPAHGGGPSDATVATNVKVQSDTMIVTDVPAESHFMKSEGGHAKVSVVAASVPSNDVPFTYR